MRKRRQIEEQAWDRIRRTMLQPTDLGVNLVTGYKIDEILYGETTLEHLVRKTRTGLKKRFSNK